MAGASALMTGPTDATAPGWADSQRLLRQARDGDGEAARRLVDAHSARIYGLAQRMLGDSAEAEDVTQQTFLTLWDRGEQFRGHSSLGTYLHRIAANLCLDRLRRRDPRLQSLDEELILELPDTAAGPAVQFEQQQSREDLQRQLSRLPARQRMALMLWAYHDAGPAELGEVFDLSANAASQLLHRAQSNLRTLMTTGARHVQG